MALVNCLVASAAATLALLVSGVVLVGHGNPDGIGCLGLVIEGDRRLKGAVRLQSEGSVVGRTVAIDQQVGIDARTVVVGVGRGKISHRDANGTVLGNRCARQGKVGGGYVREFDKGDYDQAMTVVVATHVVLVGACVVGTAAAATITIII